MGFAKKEVEDDLATKQHKIALTKIQSLKEKQLSYKFILTYFTASPPGIIGFLPSSLYGGSLCPLLMFLHHFIVISECNDLSTLGSQQSASISQFQNSRNDVNGLAASDIQL